jgi:hypothetical protein
VSGSTKEIEMLTWKCAERVGMVADDEGPLEATTPTAAMREAIQKALDAAPNGPYDMGVWIEAEDGSIIASEVVEVPKPVAPARNVRSVITGPSR